MLKPNGSREDMRVSKETDVNKLSEAVAIQLRRSGRCRLRASGEATILMALRVIKRQRSGVNVRIWDEDAPTDSSYITVTVFELTVGDMDA